ncbi:MAG: hypothetical protein ACXVAY_09975 [Mucilaginibacter sp.]
MRIIFSFLLISILLKANAQENITYKIKYLPEHQYTYEQTSNSVIELELKGDKEATIKLQMSGLGDHVTIEMDHHKSFTINTGVLNKDKKYTFVIKYSDIYDNAIANGEVNKIDNLLANNAIYAHIKDNGKIALDTLPDGKAYSKRDEAIEAELKELQAQTQLPDENLKIGDTFTTKVPVNISIPGVPQFPIMAKVAYKLVEIKDKHAYFDFTESIVFNYYTAKFDVNITGQGNGKMVYDIENYLVTSENGTLNSNFNIKGLKNRVIKGAVKINTTLTGNMNR